MKKLTKCCEKCQIDRSNLLYSLYHCANINCSCHKGKEVCKHESGTNNKCRFCGYEMDCIRRLEVVPNKNIEWQDKFIKEFGIHFEFAEGELQFAIGFIEGLLSAQREEVSRALLENHCKALVLSEKKLREQICKEIEGFAIMKGSVIDKLEEKTERERITNLLNENLEIGYRQACRDILNLINSSK